MAQRGQVTVSEVRTSLNEANNYEWPDSTIAQKIDEAETIIASSTDVEATDQAIFNLAVRETAAYRTFTSAPAEIRRAALDLNSTYDAQSYQQLRKQRRDEARALVGASGGGTSAAFAGKTDGILRRDRTE